MLCTIPNTLDPSPSTPSFLSVLFVKPAHPCSEHLRYSALRTSSLKLPASRDHITINFCHFAYPITGSSAPFYSQGFLVVFWPYSVAHPHYMSLHNIRPPILEEIIKVRTQVFIQNLHRSGEKKRGLPLSGIISMHGWTNSGFICLK